MCMYICLPLAPFLERRRTRCTIGFLHGGVFLCISLDLGCNHWFWCVNDTFMVLEYVGAQVGDSQCNDSKVLQAVADILKECLGESSSTKE